MQKYVKTKDLPLWCLYYDKTAEIDSQRFSDRLFNAVANNYIKGKTSAECLTIASRGVNYESLRQKYGTILIHENGTWHCEDDSNITDVCYSNGFPYTDNYDTVVCENDFEVDLSFIETLKEKGCKNVRVLNYFDNRDISEIAAAFKQAKTVAFSTTFTSFEWFKTLLLCLNKENKVIGSCFDKDRIAVAKSLANEKGFFIDFM
jgi:hypothetical protein